MKRKVLNLMKVTIFVLAWLVCLYGSAQEITVRGNVSDANGDPLIGATIQIKGRTIGTITDMDGRFVLQNVPSNSALEVSYLGMLTQTVALEGRSTINIVLQEDLELLDEIIVIGYGTAKRKDFTGSVSSVKLEDSPVALASNLNALEAIKGNVSGLDIGATNSAGGQPSMQMRGQKSISGSNDPLIVLDGVIFMGSINDINPNDIASFDILKDATSAAAYGSRSANGVIIITTKKGKSDKPIINFNASGSLQSWINRPKLMNGEQWIESVMARNNSTDLTWLKPQEAANREAGKETNWLDASTRTGWIQDYQLSVSGSGEKMNYYLSASYADNQGVIIGDDFNRASFLGKIKTDITSWLEIGVDAAFTKSDYSGVGAAINQAYVMSPYGVMYRDEEKKLLEKYPYTQSGQNPLWGVTNGSRDNTDLRDNFRMNAYTVIKLPWLPGLSYRFNYAGNIGKERRSDFYYESHYVKEGAYDDESRYSPEAYQNLLSNANGSIDNRNITSWVIDNILNYVANFDKHSIDLTLVATRDRRDYKREVMTGNDFAANGNTTLGINGLHKATVQRSHLKGTGDPISDTSAASYSFDNKYFLTASYRRMGFGIRSKSKMGDFMAFGSAWRITNEPFMNDENILDDLKLKLSWGKNGNQGLSPYGTLSTIRNGAEAAARYQFGNSSNILYGMIPGTLGNADLGWETTESWNTGFESAWLNNRIFLDVDLYFSKTTDQIFERNIPVMTGFKTIKSSLAKLTTEVLRLPCEP